MSERSKPARSAARRPQALGESTRSRILRYLEESGSPVRVATIAAELGLNHTGIRRHLAALRDAGLVIEERVTSQARGRPALEYRAAQAGTFESPGALVYEELALLLLGLRGNALSPRAVGAEQGRKAVSGSATTDSLDRLQAEMARRGFEPELRRRGSTVDLVAGHCGMEMAALADPDVVCEIHRGMIEGILEATGGDLMLSAATPRNPTVAGCRFHIGPVPRPGSPD